MPDSQRYSKKLCLIKYELNINVYDFKLIIFKCDFSTKLSSEIKTLRPRKNDDIFNIIGHKNVSRVPL